MNTEISFFGFYENNINNPFMLVRRVTRSGTIYGPVYKVRKSDVFRRDDDMIIDENLLQETVDLPY